MHYQIICVRQQNMNDTDYLRFGASAGKSHHPPALWVTFPIIVNVCTHVSKGAIMSACVRDDVFAEGRGSPLWTCRGERCPLGSRGRGLCVVIYVEWARRWRNSPSGGHAVAPSAWPAVAANSCWVSKHTAWQTPENRIDTVNSCIGFWLQTNHLNVDLFDLFCIMSVLNKSCLLH